MHALFIGKECWISLKVPIMTQTIVCARYLYYLGIHVFTLYLRQYLFITYSLHYTICILQWIRGLSCGLQQGLAFPLRSRISTLDNSTKNYLSGLLMVMAIINRPKGWRLECELTGKTQPKLNQWRLTATSSVTKSV